MTPLELMCNALGVGPKSLEGLEGWEAYEQIMDQGLDLIEAELQVLYRYLLDGICGEGLSQGDAADVASTLCGISERLPALRELARGSGRLVAPVPANTNGGGS